jgi:hypothetical protein
VPIALHRTTPFRRRRRGDGQPAHAAERHERGSLVAAAVRTFRLATTRVASLRTPGKHRARTPTPTSTAQRLSRNAPLQVALPQLNQRTQAEQ